MSLPRNRREAGSGFSEEPSVDGSGDGSDYEDEYDGDYEDGDGEDDVEQPPDVVPPGASSKLHPEQEGEHPHRHHHGEGTIIAGVSRRAWERRIYLGIYLDFYRCLSENPFKSSIWKKTISLHRHPAEFVQLGCVILINISLKMGG